MKTGIFIFARMDSKRLPQKALRFIGQRPLIGHVIDRAKEIGCFKTLVLLTTDRNIDNPLVDFAKKEKISYFRGDQNNVLKRAIECAEYFGFKSFARICGDRPFHCPEILKTLINIHEKKKYDLTTNCLIKTFPRGITTEIVSTDCLKKVSLLTNNQFDLEHITNYIYENTDQFRIFNLKYKGKSLEKYNLTVDTPQDLNKAKWIVSKLGSNISEVKIEKIFSLMRLWDQIYNHKTIKSN